MLLLLLENEMDELGGDGEDGDICWWDIILSMGLFAEDGEEDGDIEC